MDKTTLFSIGGIVVVFAVVFGVLLSVDQGQQKQADVLATADASNGTIFVASKMHDFGTIDMGDGKVNHRYKLTNNSEEPVMLGEIYTSCMCTTAQAVYADGEVSVIAGMRGHGPPTYLNKTVEPGESVEIEAVFDPAAHGPSGVGPINRSILIKTNSLNLPQLELAFEANVTR